MTRISKFINKLKGGDFFQVMLQSLITLFIRVFGAFSGFILNICVAITLVPGNAGELFTLLSLAVFCGQVSTLGLGNWLLKRIGAAKGAKNFEELNELMSQSIYIVLMTGVAIGAIVFSLEKQIVEMFFAEGFDSSQISVIALSIPLVALIALFLSAFQAVGKPAVGIMAQSVIQPLLFGVICLLLVDNLDQAVNGYIISLVVTLPVAVYYWSRLSYTSLFRINMTVIVNSAKEIIPFFSILVLGLALTQLPILLSAALLNSEQVAYFSVAMRVAGLASFVLVACNMVLSPHFSHLKGSGDLKQVESFAKKGTILMIVLGSPLFVLLLVFPEFLLSFFGEEYLQAKFLLQILAIGQFVKVLAGPVGSILMMTGFEKLFNKLQALNLLTFVAFVVAGSMLGIQASYIAQGVACGVALQHLIAMLMVKIKLGFSTLPTRARMGC